MAYHQPDREADPCPTGGRQQSSSDEANQCGVDGDGDVAGGKDPLGATTRKSSAARAAPTSPCSDDLREHHPSAAWGGQQRRRPGGVVELAGGRDDSQQCDHEDANATGAEDVQR